MRVICIIVADNVDECMVVNDEQEQEVIAKLADANDTLPKDERVRIHTLTPTPIEQIDAIIDFILTP